MRIGENHPGTRIHTRHAATAKNTDACIQFASFAHTHTHTHVHLMHSNCASCVHSTERRRCPRQRTNPDGLQLFAARRPLWTMRGGLGDVARTVFDCNHRARIGIRRTDDAIRAPAPAAIIVDLHTQRAHRSQHRITQSYADKHVAGGNYCDDMCAN